MQISPLIYIRDYAGGVFRGFAALRLINHAARGGLNLY